MTTASTDTSAPSTTRDRTLPSQRAVLTRTFTVAGMRSLLITTGVMLVVLAVGALIARWRGWQLVGMTETDMVGLEVITDGDGVTLVASLFILPVAISIAAVVMAVVLAARTRVYVATGATRRTVAVGQLLTLLVMTAYVLLVSAVVLLVVGRGLDGARELVQADGAGEVAMMGIRALGTVLLALTAASAITALFLRWPWWVGTGVLILLFVVLPGLTAFLLPSVAETVDRASAWWGWDLASAVVTTGVYWWVIRRVPVR